MSKTTSQLPLFLKTPVLMDVKRHANAGIRGDLNYKFAKSTNSIPVNATEFNLAGRFYPIVFTDEAIPTPVAIVGLEQDNYFVNAKGDWKEEAYIPAYVRKYPFVFAELNDAKQLALCVDEDAPHFQLIGKGKNISKLYNNNKPTAFTNHALEFCTAYHNHFALTKQFAKMLKDYRLLSPYQSEAILNTGRIMRLGGFQSIDQKALDKLSDEKFLELRKLGWLPLIYFVLQSASNWKALVDMASSEEKPAKKSAKKA